MCSQSRQHPRPQRVELCPPIPIPQGGVTARPHANGNLCSPRESWHDVSSPPADRPCRSSNNTLTNSIAACVSCSARQDVADRDRLARASQQHEAISIRIASHSTRPAPPAKPVPILGLPRSFTRTEAPSSGRRKLVFLSSPFRGEVEDNLSLAQRFTEFAAREGILRFAPKVYFRQILPDLIDRGLRNGLSVSMLTRCDEVSMPGTPTCGMNAILLMAEALEIPIVEVNHRTLLIEVRRQQSLKVMD